MVGTPVVEMHIEAETDSCTCRKFGRCGGIMVMSGDCPEHFEDSMEPQVPFHTHARQVDRITRGRWIR